MRNGLPRSCFERRYLWRLAMASEVAFFEAMFMEAGHV